MDIKIIAVEQQTKQNPGKKAYQVLSVDYKNLTFQGKVENKVLMSFGAQMSAYEMLSLAQNGEEYSVQVVKNDKGYNDWVSITKGSGTNQGAQQAASAAPVSAARTGNAQGTATPVAQKGNWETPEERAKKQIYIVRQHNITAAISALAAKPGSPLDVADILKVAREFENYVFGTQPEDMGTEDSGSIYDLTNDIPD